MRDPTLLEDAAAIGCYLEALVAIRRRRWAAIDEVMKTENQDQEQLRYGWDLAKAIGYLDIATAKGIMLDLAGRPDRPPASPEPTENVHVATNKRSLLRYLRYKPSYGKRKLEQLESQGAIRVVTDTANNRTKYTMTVLEPLIAYNPRG